MNDDATLLRRYASEGSQTAFAELVQRHVDLVYGAAMRRTGGDAHRAAEVAQEVFTALAKNARKLSAHTVLPAWLYTATRNASLNLLVAEQRRKTREATAMEMESLTPGNVPDPDWDQIKPLLDAAIDELPEADRTAIVLRFLQKRSFAEIGRAVQVSEDAARMRTDRALDKLRTVLARRGITSTVTALGAAVLGQPAIAAPAGLAASLATQAFAGSGAGFLVTLTSFMTTKIITTAVISALIAFGAGKYVGHKNDVTDSSLVKVPAATTDQSQLVASLKEDNRRLTAQASELDAEIVRLNRVNAALPAKQASRPAVAATAVKSPNIGLPPYELKRAVLANLRQIESARQQFALDNKRPAQSVRDLVGVGGYIKTVRTVGGEDYSNVSMQDGQPLTVTTPDGVTVTYDPAGTLTTPLDIPPEVAKVQELKQKVQPSVMKAVEAYRAAHNGDNPPSEDAVLPFFASPQEGADYVEFMAARRSVGL